MERFGFIFLYFSLKPQAKSRISIVEFGIESMLYENFDVFEHYGVEEYMASFGLSVDKKYRGRRIGDQLLATRLEK